MYAIRHHTSVLWRARLSSVCLLCMLAGYEAVSLICSPTSRSRSRLSTPGFMVVPRRWDQREDGLMDVQWCNGGKGGCTSSIKVVSVTPVIGTEHFRNHPLIECLRCLMRAALSDLNHVLHSRKVWSNGNASLSLSPTASRCILEARS